MEFFRFSHSILLVQCLSALPERGFYICSPNQSFWGSYLVVGSEGGRTKSHAFSRDTKTKWLADVAFVGKMKQRTFEHSVERDLTLPTPRNASSSPEQPMTYTCHGHDDVIPRLIVGRQIGQRGGIIPRGGGQITQRQHRVEWEVKIARPALEMCICPLKQKL